MSLYIERLWYNREVEGGSAAVTGPDVVVSR